MVEVEPAALLERHVRQIAGVPVLVEQRDGMSGEAPPQRPELFAKALERARQLADDCASPSAEGLHLIVALARLSRSAAAALLDRLVNLASLRTTALGYLTGSVPRRRVAQEVRVGSTD